MIGRLMAERARVLGAASVEQQSTTRDTTRPTPPTGRHPDAIAAEKRKRRESFGTRPCPDCVGPGMANSPDATGSGLVADPDRGPDDALTLIDCGKCDGVGRVKRVYAAPVEDKPEAGIA